MTDENHEPDAEAKLKADEIKDVEATQQGALGNVHSTKEDDDPEQEAPPPHPI